MRVWIANHTLCIGVGSPPTVYMVRPCSTLDGKFRYRDRDLKWFRVSRFDSHSGQSKWSLFAVPYLCVGRVRIAPETINA